MASPTENCNLDDYQVTENKTKTRNPPLRNSADVRRELARVYWQAKNGGLDIAAASRLGNMLSILGRLIQSDCIEERLIQLEKLVENR